MSKPELLSPVQDFTSLKAAIDSGADAIYFGVKELNMRMGAKNFELKDVVKIIDQCHKKKVKAYCTLNTIIYDNEINKLRKILGKLKKDKIDAIIAWDFSVIEECERLKLPVHLSTQASISNFRAIRQLKKKFKNIKRVNLARELSLERIKTIIKLIKEAKLKVEIETFVHGAMCVSVSGRCFLSQQVFNKSANRGECLQPCRRRYLINDSEEGHGFKLGEEYVLSPKDLCAIEILDKLKKAGIDAFKIEGRNRSPEYVNVVTACYREAIDKGYRPALLKRLKKVYNRGFSTGFYLGMPMNEWSKAYGSKASKKKTYIGKVKNYYKKVKVAEIVLEAGVLKLKDFILIQGPTTGVVEQKVGSIQKNHESLLKAKKGERIAVIVDKLVRKNDKVYLFM